MKKLGILLIMVTALILSGLSMENGKLAGKNYELYIKPNSYTSIGDGTDIVRCGTFDMVRCNLQTLDIDDIGKDNIIGGCVRYKADAKEIHSVISHLDIIVVDRDTIDNKYILYGYSPKIQNSIIHKGHEVNIELIYGNNMIEIGTPLIMGSY